MPLNHFANTYIYYAAALSAVIFVIDLNLPLGVAGGVPYVVPVLLSFFSPRPRHIFIMAGLCSALTVLGYFLSQSGGILWVVLTNRFLALLAIWGVAIAILRFKLGEEALIRSKEELAAVNKELEAFAYSVSHDLRSPLRGIDGFSQALLEDYGDKVDGEGKNYIARIRSASQKMGHLIDELLELSRVTRSGIRREAVDLSTLAREVAEELRESHPERNVEILIEEGLSANGDISLMRIVLVNLIGNSWKFTEKQPNARVEIGRSENNGNKAYFVRDNGAGFDMKYAGKLFGVFQRLHLTSEFEGTGIGLATVQRIINRHGGRIWGEAEVDKGAVFYFTMR